MNRIVGSNFSGIAVAMEPTLEFRKVKQEKTCPFGSICFDIYIPEFRPFEMISGSLDRVRLADADPWPGELLRRIRGWDVAMTELKTTDLLAELPTKRLLMKYTEGFVAQADPPDNTQACFSHFD